MNAPELREEAKRYAKMAANHTGEPTDRRIMWAQISQAYSAIYANELAEKHLPVFVTTGEVPSGPPINDTPVLESELDAGDFWVGKGSPRAIPGAPGRCAICGEPRDDCPALNDRD